MSATYADPAVLFVRMLRRCTRSSSGCWIYTGSTNSRGYSQVGSGKRSKNITGHRLAVIARDGFIPDGMTVDHTCHNSAQCFAGDTCVHRTEAPLPACTPLGVAPTHRRVANMDTSSSWQVGALIFVGAASVAAATVLGTIFLGLAIDGAVAVGRRRRAANRDLTRGFDS